MGTSRDARPAELRSKEVLASARASSLLVCTPAMKRKLHSFSRSRDFRAGAGAGAGASPALEPAAPSVSDARELTDSVRWARAPAGVLCQAADIAPSWRGQ